MTTPDAATELAGRRRPVVELNPSAVAAGVLALAALALGVTTGWQELAQTTINGLVSGSYFALGAAGLTLVFGVLKLVNFAHGEFLTFAAYMVIAADSLLGLPFAARLVVAVLATAAFGLALELTLWRPMRRRGAGVLQLLLMSLGLAYVIRNVIQLIAGTDVRTIGSNVTASVTFGSLHIGRTELWAMLLGLTALLGLALLLRYTQLGKQIRALSDSPELAETTGIDTERIVLLTWVVAGSLAGLAGVVYGSSVGVVTPNLGFGIVLSLFAAVIVGGIGNAYGALAGGILIGLVQEWSTLVLPANIKVATGFVVMILVLILRPQGITGRARSADR